MQAKLRRDSCLRRRLRGEDAVEAFAVLKKDQHPQHRGHKSRSRGITFTDCTGALRAIALGVCDYLAETTSCPGQLARIPLEGSIIPVVEELFKEGLAHHGTPPGVDPALLSTTAAWAVFGAARRWFQTSNRIPAEAMAARIEAMVSPVLFGISQ